MDARTLRHRLSAAGIARPEDIAGCSEAEIVALERSLGRFPANYRAVLGAIGWRAGRLVNDRVLWISADQLAKMDRLARKQIFEDGGADHDPVPANAVFIGARQGEHPWFILARDGADSPVWHCNTGMGRVTRIGAGVWDWVREIVRDAEWHIARGLPEQKARRGR